MDDQGWLSDEADERLQGLFSESPGLIVRTVRDIIHEARNDADLEEILVDTLQTSLTNENDDTQGTAWIVVVLGELRSEAAIGTLFQALASNDEMVSSAAVRALRRVGEPALDKLMELLESDDLATDIYVAAVECLHAVQNSEDPRLRERVSEFLLGRVGAPARSSDEIRRVEAAALALARLGVPEARAPIEAALKTPLGRNNSFLRDSLEILTEQPDGIPVLADLTWESEFRWALATDLPGGDLSTLDEDAELAEELARKKKPPRF